MKNIRLFFVLLFPCLVNASTVDTKFAKNLNQINKSLCTECSKSITTTVVAKTTYTICEEDMPSNLSTFSTPECEKYKYKAGKDCLVFDELVFEEKLKKSNLAEYNRYISAKEINDSGNSQACIRYSNGVFKRFRTAFLNRTTEISKFIIETAKYYGVNPETIPCAIGGDATTTLKGYADQKSYDNRMIQRNPVKLANEFFTTKGIKFDSPPTAPSNITPEETRSIRESALIIRHGLEVYKEAGFKNEDLRPEILASIYHLGAFRGSPPVNSAVKRMAEGGKPGMSFIGLFCYRNLGTIQKSIGLK